MNELLSFDRGLLPPMTALRAFAAAARLGSFTLAAEELHVTQGAVSRQIKLLETHLGVALFERVRQRVALTEAGRYYAAHVNEILGRLMAAGTQTLAVAAPDFTLHIGMIPTFCSQWIIPRLPDFMEKNPRIHLRISAVGRDLNFLEEQCDAVLIVGNGPWVDTVSLWLGPEELIPVAAPKFLQSHRIEKPEDFRNAPLIHTSRDDLWRRWFALNSVDQSTVPLSRLDLEQILMIIEAAVAGLGAALLPRVLIERELASGALVELQGKPLTVSDGYYFVHARHMESYPPLAAFRAWLIDVFRVSASSA